jgi:hypothetical protein
LKKHFEKIKQHDKKRPGDFLQVELSYRIMEINNEYDSFKYKFGYLYCLDLTSLEIQRMATEVSMVPDFTNRVYE